MLPFAWPWRCSTRNHLLLWSPVTHKLHFFTASCFLIFYYFHYFTSQYVHVCKCPITWHWPRVNKFIYLFSYRFVQCTVERIIGHVVPYLVRPPNPTPCIKCRKTNPLLQKPRKVMQLMLLFKYFCFSLYCYKSFFN